MKSEWMRLRYTDEEGAIVKEVWAETMIWDSEYINKQMETAAKEIHAPKITCTIEERGAKRPQLNSEFPKKSRHLK